MSSDLHNLPYTWWIAIFFLIGTNGIIYLIFWSRHHILHLFFLFTIADIQLSGKKNIDEYKRESSGYPRPI